MADENTNQETNDSPGIKPEKTITVNLKYELITNGVKHGPGRVELNEEMAEELLRRDAEYDEVERKRLTYEDIMLDISAITGTVLSGAGMEIPE